MREIGAFEAKNRLGTLLDWVEGGEEVVITRRGKPVARLVPLLPTIDVDATRKAAEAILARRPGVAIKLAEIRALVDTGRP